MYQRRRLGRSKNRSQQMDNSLDWVAIVISIASLAGAAYSFTYTRKTFIFSVCTERAKEVKYVWKQCEKVNGMHTVHEDFFQFWSPVISEIVASIIIIERLSDRYKILRFLYSVDDFYIIFWQQVPTDLRSAIEAYEVARKHPRDEYITTFRTQMETIHKAYRK